jgi:hypothetical protein
VAEAQAQEPINLCKKTMSTETNIDLTAKCLQLWDDGNDTYIISRTLGPKECEVERMLHKALEQRRRNNLERKR